MPYLTGQVITQADLAALFTSGTYTPTLGSMAIGTGGTPINTAKFTFVGFPAGGVLTVEGKIKFGTTSVTLPGAGSETISLPAGYSLINTETLTEMPSGCQFSDVSPVNVYKGIIRPNTATTVRLISLQVSGTALIQVDITATVPFTWAINDEIYWSIVARCTGP